MNSITREVTVVDALEEVLQFQSANVGPTIHDFGRWRRALHNQVIAAPVEQCWCDEQGIGEPGVSCGDCPRDYIKPSRTFAAPVTDEEVDAVFDVLDLLRESITTGEMRRALEGFAAGRAAGVGPAVAPKGWQLVPVEPTLAMMDAMDSSAYKPGCYRAMLAAAPHPAVVEPSGNQFISPFKFEREEISDSATKGETHE